MVSTLGLPLSLFLRTFPVTSLFFLVQGRPVFVRTEWLDFDRLTSRPCTGLLGGIAGRLLRYMYFYSSMPSVFPLLLRYFLLCRMWRTTSRFFTVLLPTPLNFGVNG